MTSVVGENSMSVQYPGCRAAILGVIHHHCSDTSFKILHQRFTPGLSPRRALLPCVMLVLLRLMIQINEEVRVIFFPIQFYVGTLAA